MLGAAFGRDVGDVGWHTEGRLAGPHGPLRSGS